MIAGQGRMKKQIVVTRIDGEAKRIAKLQAENDRLRSEMKLLFREFCPFDEFFMRTLRENIEFTIKYDGTECRINIMARNHKRAVTRSVNYIDVVQSPVDLVQKTMREMEEEIIKEGF